MAKPFAGDLGEAMIQVIEIATKSGTTVEQAAKVFAACTERRHAIEDSRRSSPEDRAGIDAYMDSLNGNISADMPVSDIVAGAGVAKKQGTFSYAKQALKRALLTYHKPAQ